MGNWVLSAWGKLHLCEDPWKMCLKSFSAASAQQGSAKPQVPLKCSHLRGARVGPEGGSRDTLSCTAPRLGNCQQAPKAAFGIWVPNSC